MQALSGIFLAGKVGREIDWYLRDGNSQVYVYEFTYPSDIGLPYDVNGWRRRCSLCYTVSAPSLAVFHTEEIPFIFMQAYFWEPAVDSGKATANDFAMADFMGQTWTDFAKQGFVPFKQALLYGWRLDGPRGTTGGLLQEPPGARNSWTFEKGRNACMRDGARPTNCCGTKYCQR